MNYRGGGLLYLGWKQRLTACKFQPRRCKRHVEQALASAHSLHWLGPSSTLTFSFPTRGVSKELFWRNAWVTFWICPWVKRISPCLHLGDKKQVGNSKINSAPLLISSLIHSAVIKSTFCELFRVLYAGARPRVRNIAILSFIIVYACMGNQCARSITLSMP